MIHEQSNLLNKNENNKQLIRFFLKLNYARAACVIGDFRMYPDIRPQYSLEWPACCEFFNDISRQ